MNVIPFNRRGFTQRDVDNLLLVQALASAQQPTAVRFWVWHVGMVDCV